MVSRRTVLKTMAASLTAGTMPTASAYQIASRSKIRIGQIGTTHAHASKLSVYRASEDYEVVGLVEPDLKRREAAEQNAVFNGLPWMTAEQLLNQPVAYDFSKSKENYISFLECGLKMNEQLK